MPQWRRRADAWTRREAGRRSKSAEAGMKPLSPACITGNADRERRSNRGGTFALLSRPRRPSSADPRPGVPASVPAGRPSHTSPGSTSCCGVPRCFSVIKNGSDWCLKVERRCVPARTSPPSMWCFLPSALVNDQLLVSVCPRFYLRLTQKDVGVVLEGRDKDTPTRGDHAHTGGHTHSGMPRPQPEATPFREVMPSMRGHTHSERPHPPWGHAHPERPRPLPDTLS